MTEIQLIEAVKKGNQSKLELLIKQYTPLVSRILRRFCKYPIQDFEDLQQEVWTKVYFEIKKLKRIDSFKGWLSRIAYHLGIDYLKKKKIDVVDTSETIIAEEAKQEKQIFESELQKAIWQEIKTLKEKYQTPLVLYYFEQFSYEEIANITGNKLNTVKSLIRRAKTQLGEKLEKKGVAKWNL